MDKRDLIPLEMGEVQRTPTSGGDRLMLLLAGLALAGGLAVAIGNLLPPEEVTAQASGSAAPTVQATRTPRPTPTEEPLRQMVVTPGDPPLDPSVFHWRDEWIRALEDLPIHSAATLDTLATDTLPAGGVGLVQPSPGGVGVPGWLYLVDGAPEGWIYVGEGPDQLVERYPVGQPSWANTWVQVQAGEAGFLAEADDGTVAISPTGASWQRYLPQSATEYPSEWWQVAWGPSGWIAPSFDFHSPGPATTFLWQSDDGRSWTPLGRISADARGFNVMGLWGSSMGYLLWGSVDGSRERFWFSTNGLAWLEMPSTGLSIDAWAQVVGTPFGFYVSDGRPDSRVTPFGVFTADGATWQPISDGPRSQSSLIAPLGDGLLAMDRDPSSAARVWIGGLGPEGFSWRQVDSGRTFEGIVPAVVVGDGGRAVVIGWERATETVRTWASRDGATWKSVPVPPGGFGVIPHQAIGAAPGILVLGIAQDNGLQAAKAWKLVGEEWRPVDLAAALGIGIPPLVRCPSTPTSAVEFVALDAGLAVHCLGDQPITFRAYSVPCDGCQGRSDPSYSPSWMAPGDPPMYLSPIVTENVAWLDIVLDPSVEPSPAWEKAWVEVVGHYDDPIAADCRRQVDRAGEDWYPGRQQLIEECRRRFVITEVTVVDGP